MLKKHHTAIGTAKGGRQYRHVGGVLTDAANAYGFNDNVTGTRYEVWFHAPRHTLACWPAQSGVDIYVLMKFIRLKKKIKTNF